MTGDRDDGPASLPDWLDALPLARVVRIDLGLEGAWSETVVPVWTPADGFLDLEGVARSHPVHRPCLELYLDGGWIGLHCFTVREGEHVLDEARLRAAVARVEAARGS